MSQDITITVYGAAQICPSCIGAPGSKDTYEWLQAAIGRKYIADDIKYVYVDITQEHEDPTHKAFVERIFEEDLFYPIVFVNDEMVGEGIPQLKTVYKELDARGVQLQEA